ncbi:NAD(P)/FAD-dependent oxidoreductase [bacterium]|nr:MAG: NAD(P)/FAD-dependent oxidoreductase [bacterium]
MGMDQVEYLLIGGGVASAQAATAIRSVDGDGAILISGNEKRLPYDRPPLSKSLMRGETTPEDAESKMPEFYSANNVALRQSKVVRLDVGSNIAEHEDGTQVRYQKLLLATGSKPKRLEIEGAEHVHVLRTVEQSLEIREALEKAKTAVFIGTGYIGTEVGSVALLKGVDVTFLDKGDFPWQKFASETTGGFIRKTYEDRGAKFEFGAEIDHAEPGAIVLKDGRRFEADVLVMGVGVEQNLDLAKQAGLELDPKHGVVADAYLQTSHPGIYVAGDIAAFEDVTLGKRWHAEHYLNAKWQGQTVGKTMAGEATKYDRVPYFFSDFLDLHMVLRGDPQGGESARIIGDVDSGEYTELYAREDGTLAMGMAFSHDESKTDALADKLEELFRAKAKVSAIDLS